MNRKTDISRIQFRNCQSTQVCGPQTCVLLKKAYICHVNQLYMERTFIFGVSVSGDNFTDRIEETRHLTQNFENGLNTILISPRRTGKTSLVNKVCDNFAGNPKIRIVRMDIYDCRNEYDFYNKFATSVLKATSSRMEQILETAKEFLYRVVPQMSISPDPTAGYSFSLKINPKDMSSDEILSLPERIAAKKI